MNNIAEKFARILILKLKKESCDDFLESLDLLNSMLENRKFAAFMRSSAVHKQSKINLIKLLASKFFLKNTEILKNMLISLIKSNNFMYFRDIKSLVNKKILEKNKITETQIYFAKDPSDIEVRSVEKILEQKYKINPKISVNVDETIIGGFIASFDGKMLDASLRNNFNRFSNNIQNKFH